MAQPPQIARRVRLETARYVLRTVEAGDATAGWEQWLLDPAAARWLNATPRAASLDEIRDYIATFDNKSSHLIGIFEKDTGRLIGIHSIYVDWPRSEYLINVMVGESDARNQGARSEARPAIHQFFMEELGLEASLATVIAGHPSLAGMQRWGWVVERKSTRPAATDGAPVAILHMRLTREAWRRAFRGTGG
jgi:RimJ/RimL family protein N-acetyltransferase